MLTDTHCHLDLARFDEDREAVVERAREAGVERILVPGLDLESSREVVKLAERFDLVYAAVGVHPNSSKSWMEAALDELRALAGHEKVVAIGEIGLDYYWDRAPIEHQKMVFSAQLALAAELKLPVVVHNRESSDDVVDMLVSWQADLAESGNPLAARPGVMHSFSAGQKHAEQILPAGFFIGITGPVTFKNAQQLHDLVPRLRLDRLMLETDAPFLTPHPHRGKRNEPAYVRDTALRLADARGETGEALAAATTANARTLFGSIF